MLNLGSLLLGLFSWLLPVTALFCRSMRRRQVCGVLSALACSAALYLQVWAGAVYAEREDCSALLDTLPTAAKLSLILLVGTVLVNGLLLAGRGAVHTDNT